MEVKRADWDNHRQEGCIRECEHEGCKKTVVAELMAKHAETCHFRPVTCVCGKVRSSGASCVHRSPSFPTAIESLSRNSEQSNAMT
jgi:hypothetical protein